MDVHLRRVQRADLDAVLTLAEAEGLPIPAINRANLHRFRNIVGDLGCDFDVATTRARLRGFVHVVYGRDLLRGNRASLLALVGDSSEIRDALLERAIDRARRRQCCDLTGVAGPWLGSIDDSPFAERGDCAGAMIRIDLQGAREQSVAVVRTPPGALPAD